MQKFVRTECPAILAEKWQKWGETYAKNRERDPGFVFQWPQIEGQKLNQVLLPELQKMTRQHCSYCDGYPLRIADQTIDHFHPKSDARFYQEVCQWENLYAACRNCQCAKKEDYDEQLLRPDAPDYDFTRYFIYSFIEHTIHPNPRVSSNDQKRAEMTIKIFYLNEPGLIETRRIEFERYNSTDSTEYILDDFSFRFMLL